MSEPSAIEDRYAEQTKTALIAIGRMFEPGAPEAFALTVCVHALARIIGELAVNSPEATLAAEKGVDIASRQISNAVPLYMERARNKRA